MLIKCGVQFRSNFSQIYSLKETKLHISLLLLSYDIQERMQCGRIIFTHIYYKHNTYRKHSAKITEGLDYNLQIKNLQIKISHTVDSKRSKFGKELKFHILEYYPENVLTFLVTCSIAGAKKRSAFFPSPSLPPQFYFPLDLTPHKG